MTESQANVKCEGLFIPEPVVAGLSRMDYVDVGRVVIHLIEISHGLPICQSNVEGMSQTASVVSGIWAASERARRARDGRN